MFVGVGQVLNLKSSVFGCQTSPSNLIRDGSIFIDEVESIDMFDMYVCMYILYSDPLWGYSFPSTSISYHYLNIYLILLITNLT